MPVSMTPKSAIAAIDKAGALLVFPLDNRKEPASIWSHFYPKEKMKWEWDEDGDDRVGTLWHLRADLSTTRKVVYTKWFRGRATYFSKELFTAILRGLNPLGSRVENLSSDARKVLRVLESESPLSTKELKRMAGFQGKENERSYDKALKELWSRLLIVAYGEVDDGAFPSLAVGSTKVLFEDLWAKAFAMETSEAQKKVVEILPQKNLFFLHYVKLKTQMGAKKKWASSTKADKPIIPKMIRFEDL